MRPATVYVSATPGPWEMERTGGVFAEQVIRPTGLIDPPVEIRPVETQVDDLIAECRLIAKRGYRALVTTLTKKMAEDLTEYMHEQGIRVRYMHSDVETLERIEIIRDLRLGAFDVLIGINLLREGLDIPECALVAILDADKEGFLRSETSLIQTIGRAARNVDGKVILYADHITGSMERAMAETGRRREKQDAYNEAHGITPLSIKKSIADIMGSMYERDHVTVDAGGSDSPKASATLSATIIKAHLADLEKQMRAGGRRSGIRNRGAAARRAQAADRGGTRHRRRSVCAAKRSGTRGRRRVPQRGARWHRLRTACHVEAEGGTLADEACGATKRPKDIRQSQQVESTLAIISIMRYIKSELDSRICKSRG